MFIKLTWKACTTRLVKEAVSLMRVVHGDKLVALINSNNEGEVKVAAGGKTATFNSFHITCYP